MLTGDNINIIIIMLLTPCLLLVIMPVINNKAVIITGQVAAPVPLPHPPDTA